MDRIQLFIHSEFDNFLKKYNLQIEINNALIELRNRLYEL